MRSHPYFADFPATAPRNAASGDANGREFC